MIERRSSIPSRTSEARGPVPLFRPSGARHRSRAVARSAPRRRGRLAGGRRGARSPVEPRTRGGGIAWQDVKNVFCFEAPSAGRVGRVPGSCDGRCGAGPRVDRRRTAVERCDRRAPTGRRRLGTSGDPVPVIGPGRRPRRAPDPVGHVPARIEAGPSPPLRSIGGRRVRGPVRDHGRCPTSRAPTTRPRPRPGRRRARGPGSAPRRTRSCTAGRSRRPRAR